MGRNQDQATDLLQPNALEAAASRVFDLLDPPLWLVTAAHEERRGGFIATFAARASIAPELPRVVLGVAKQHYTWGMIEASGRFALHLLYPYQLDLVWRFGVQTGHEMDKFAGLEIDDTPGGSPLIRETLAWLDCRVEEHMDTGDRTIYLAAVEAAASSGRAEPLSVRRLYANAPDDLRKRLDDLYARDGRIDAEAILRWRGRRTTT